MSSREDIERHYTGTLMLEATSYKVPKNEEGLIFHHHRDHTHFERGSDIIVSKMPSGDYGLFMKIHEFADTMVPTDAPNYPSTRNNPINPASTDIKFKAYVRLDPEKFGFTRQQLEYSAHFGRAIGLHMLPSPEELKPDQLYRDEHGRPQLNIAYGGWGQLKDPGGSDAIYTLNMRGVNYQLEFTLPAAHEAAVRMQKITGGQPYDVQGFSHSTGAPHTSLMAAVQGSDKLNIIMPGAADFRWEEHEPVGGAGASAVISRTLGATLFPQEVPAQAVQDTAGSIIAHVDSIVSQSRPDGKTEAQPTLLRTYNPYFDQNASRASGGNVVCVLFDGGGRDWNINHLDFTGSITPGGAAFAGPEGNRFKGMDFFTGFMPHMSGKMGNLMQDWQHAVVTHAENAKMCVEGPMTVAQLVDTGTKPSVQTPKETAWDHMLRDVQSTGIELGWLNMGLGIIPGANKRLAKAGSDEVRPDVNAHLSPFAAVLAQLGNSDAAIGQAIKERLDLNMYGNGVDPKLALNPLATNFSVTARTTSDGGFAVRIEDLNNSYYGRDMFKLMERSGAGASEKGISVHSIGNGITISAASAEDIGHFLDRQVAMHTDKVSADIAKIEQQHPLTGPVQAPARIKPLS